MLSFTHSLFAINIRMWNRSLKILVEIMFEQPRILIWSRFKLLDIILISIFVSLHLHIYFCWQSSNPLLFSIQWCHNGHDNVSNHQLHDYLLNRLFRTRSKKTSKLRVTGLCAGNSPVTSEFPHKWPVNAENNSIWWHHHADARSSAVCRSHILLLLTCSYLLKDVCLWNITSILDRCSRSLAAAAPVTHRNWIDFIQNQKYPWRRNQRAEV